MVEINIESETKSERQLYACVIDVVLPDREVTNVIIIEHQFFLFLRDTLLVVYTSITLQYGHPTTF